MNVPTSHIVKVARALAEPARVRLLQELAKRGSMVCVEVQHLLRLAQPTVSHHIKALLEADLIEAEKQGRHLRIWLKAATVERFCRWLEAMVQQVSVQRG
jgi:ArsR family transcriptional regulator